jgi:hypothetical protein
VGFFQGFREQRSPLPPSLIVLVLVLSSSAKGLELASKVFRGTSPDEDGSIKKKDCSSNQLA